jgi:hypothetical protein
MPKILAAPRAAAQLVMAGLVTAATVTAFVLSYRGLHDWAVSHGYPASWAWTFPLIVDAFIAVGELRLFTAAIDGATWRARLWAWLVTLSGLALSVGGNIGHAQTSDWLTRLGWAWPPLAAAAMLGIGLGSLKASAAAARGTTAHVRPHKQVHVHWPRWARWPAGWWPRRAPGPGMGGLHPDLVIVDEVAQFADEQGTPLTGWQRDVLQKVTTGAEWTAPGLDRTRAGSFGFRPDLAAEQPRPAANGKRVTRKRSTVTPAQITAAKAAIAAARAAGRTPSGRQIARDHLATDTSPLGDRRLALRLLAGHD